MQAHEVHVSVILPPKEKLLVGTSFRAPQDLLEELDAIAVESDRKRSEVMVHFLRWAVQEYRAEKRRTKK